MPETRWMAFPARLSRKVLTTGMPPATAASKRIGALWESDNTASASPCAASIALFAVTTGRPRASADCTASKAIPSAPPINSMKTSMSADAANAAASW